MAKNRKQIFPKHLITKSQKLNRQAISLSRSRQLFRILKTPAEVIMHNYAVTATEPGHAIIAAV